MIQLLLLFKALIYRIYLKIKLKIQVMAGKITIKQRSPNVRTWISNKELNPYILNHDRWGNEDDIDENGNIKNAFIYDLFYNVKHIGATSCYYMPEETKQSWWQLSYIQIQPGYTKKKDLPPMNEDGEYDYPGMDENDENDEYDYPGIDVDYTGKGYASWLLEETCKRLWNIELIPIRLKNPGGLGKSGQQNSTDLENDLENSELQKELKGFEWRRDWYKRHGFEDAGGGWMERQPPSY